MHRKKYLNYHAISSLLITSKWTRHYCITTADQFSIISRYQCVFSLAHSSASGPRVETRFRKRNHTSAKRKVAKVRHVDVDDTWLTPGGVTRRRFVRPLYRRPIGSCLALQECYLSRATYKVQLSQSEITAAARTQLRDAQWRRGDDKSEGGATGEDGER